MEIKEKILIIGNTGFIGSWLTIFLSINPNKLTYGVSIDNGNSILQKIIKRKNLIKKQYFFDAQNFERLNNTINKIKPDMIYQLAASPLVEDGIKNPYKTLKNNITITLNVLEIFVKLKNCRKIINFSSDKCYEPTKKLIKEDFNLGGKEPYSLSKAASEMIIKSYKNDIIKNKKVLINIRAGNVIGGGDINYNRIIPDLNFRIFSNKRNIILTNPNSSRPWLFIYDLLKILIKLHKRKFNDGIHDFNIGSNNNTKVVELVKKYIKYNRINIKIKKSNIKKFENENILLDCRKLKKIIKSKFIPLKHALISIYQWEYNYKYNRKELYNFTINEIKNFNLKKKNH